MSEIRKKAVRLLLQAAYEMAADNADSVADIFDCQHGFIDDLRRRAMLKLDKPYTAPKGLTFNQLSDWVDENGVGDLLDIDELDNDMVSADYEDGSYVKRKWAN